MYPRLKGSKNQVKSSKIKKLNQIFRGVSRWNIQLLHKIKLVVNLIFYERSTVLFSERLNIKPVKSSLFLQLSYDNSSLILSRILPVLICIRSPSSKSFISIYYLFRIFDLLYYTQTIHALLHRRLHRLVISSNPNTYTCQQLGNLIAECHGTVLFGTKRFFLYNSRF